jgi:hypothetical protein
VVGVPLKKPAPTDRLLGYNLVHLLAMMIATLLLTVDLAPLLDRPWFPGVRRPWLASAASLIALVTGFAALLTLATSAAAGYDPSLQFLQLLSSLDIAWVTAAIFFGAWSLWGRGSAWVLGSLVVIACVASIAAYLNVVGFTDQGGWLVDAGKLVRIVISADIVTAIVSLAVLLSAAWKKDQPMAQRSPQS